MSWRFSAAAAVFIVFTVCASAQNGQAQKSVRYYEELVGTLAGQVRQLQDDNARLAETVQELRRRVEELSRSNETTDREISELRKKIAADSVKREKQLSLIAERLKTPEKQEIPPQKEKQDLTEYEEYVVQRGATLTAIAKAYGVSIDAIKKANNKTSDALRVGEKLKIPRK